MARGTKITIRELARVISLIVTSSPAVRFGPLHYRQLEKETSTALKLSRGEFDQEVHLSQAGIGELTWWINNIQSASNDVCCSDPYIVISSDASNEGWGCECQGVSSEELWLPVEKTFYINYLELIAAFFALKAFRAVLHNKHVRLMLDNTTAMSCINHRVTSHSDSCNDLNFSLYQDLTMW